MRKILIGVLLVAMLAIFAIVVISGIQMRKLKYWIFYKINS